MCNQRCLLLLTALPCTLWTDRKVKHVYSRTSSWFTSRELFPIDWCEQKPFVQMLVNNKGQKCGLWEQFRVLRDVFKSCLLGSFGLWFICQGLLCILFFSVWVTKGQETRKGAGNYCMERSLVGFHGKISPVLSFSLLLSLFISLRFGLLFYRPLSLSRAGRKKKKRMSNCSRKVIKKNN